MTPGRRPNGSTRRRSSVPSPSSTAPTTRRTSLRAAESCSWVTRRRFSPVLWLRPLAGTLGVRQLRDCSLASEDWGHRHRAVRARAPYHAYGVVRRVTNWFTELRRHGAFRRTSGGLASFPSWPPSPQRVRTSSGRRQRHEAARRFVLVRTTSDTSGRRPQATLPSGPREPPLSTGLVFHLLTDNLSTASSAGALGQPAAWLVEAA